MAVKLFADSRSSSREIAAELSVLCRLKRRPHRNLLSFISQEDFNSVRRLENHTAIIMQYHPTSLMSIHGVIPPESLCAMLYATVASEITAGLRHLHKLGFIHRDLKPDNVLISQEGHCVIADFGSCYSGRNVEEETTLRPSGSVLITAMYAGPELLEFDNEELVYFNNRCDYFSLGKTLYYLLGNLNPASSESGDSSRRRGDHELAMKRHLGLSGSPPELIELILSLCHVDPDQRIYGDKLSSALEKMGAGGVHGDSPPFTVTWYPAAVTPLLQWNDAMKPPSVPKTSGFLSRPINHHPRTRPSSGGKESDSSEPASSAFNDSKESASSSAFNDSNEQGQRITPAAYYMFPPHLVKDVGEISPEPVVGGLCVKELNGVQHVVEIVSAWPPPTESVMGTG
ncbi:kinase-like domain-containing protein [Mycena filopes]|nr:kinase-like domain-containing protein [Mycena filopes]